jgi:hypothetical protein
MFTRKLIMLAFAGTAFSPATATLAAPASAPAAPTGTCASLARDYDQIEKGMALTWAEGVGDNSAPRDTSRKIEQSNFLARASMMLTLMQAHHCQLPDHAPSDARYMSNALTCSTDLLRSGADAPSCKMDTWQPSK